MKITKQQELDYIVSITAGLLASGHFTYVRQDSKGAEVRPEVVRTAETIWTKIGASNKIEVVDAIYENVEQGQPDRNPSEDEPRKGKQEPKKAKEK